MSLPRYPSYRDSGVPWLGNVPDHWKIRKFRYVFRESCEKIEREVVGPMLSVSGYRGIEVKEYDDENRMRLDEQLVGYRIVRVGQLVVNTMWLNYAGLGVSAHEGHVSPAYRSYAISKEVHGRFAHHLMRCGRYVQGYTQLLTGIRPNSLQMSRDDLMAFPVLLPPVSEQSAIALFLDRETAKIDALVGEQERLIAVLREKRQSVISQAVTRGLQCDVPMKESGMECLGRVPAHWKVVKLFHVLSEPPRNGISPEVFADGATPTFSIAAVRDGIVDINSHLKFVSLGTAEAGRFAVSVGDVLVLRGSGSKGLVGAAGQVVAPPPTGCIYPDILIRLRPAPRLSRSYLVASLNSAGVRPQIEAAAQTAAGIWKISGGALRELRLPLPPLSEQAAIEQHLQTETSSINRAIETAELAVELLQERRAALISAAVTGEIDVRQAAERAA